MTTPTKVDEVARRIAATTGQPYDDWRPAVTAWWAAGHDLDRLYIWAAAGHPIDPAAVIDTIRLMTVQGTPTVAPADDPLDPVALWAQRAVVWTVAAALVVVFWAATWRAVVWILP